MPYKTSASTRSGWLAVIKIAIVPPSEMPTRSARSHPAASITAPKSSMDSSNVGACIAGSERPVPRLSKVMTRRKVASRE